LPTHEPPITKHYSSIGEVAQLFNVSTSLLRYWEREFSQLKPKKTNQGIRKYSQADISELKLIYDLVKKQGYTIRGAKEALSHRHKKLKAPQELIVALKDLKAFLVDLQQYNIPLD
jgi:DNA-binding transcriptional MerR regulator